MASPPCALVWGGPPQKHFETKILRRFRRITDKVPMAMASPNILLVEDDRETRALIAKYLRTNACNVTTATDGREIARAMANHRVDPLILHRRLPADDVR